jgi:hypothetical protein
MSVSLFLRVGTVALWQRLCGAVFGAPPAQAAVVVYIGSVAFLAAAVAVLRVTC